MILHKEVKTLTYSNREFCTHTLIFCHTCAFFSQSVYTVSKFGSLWSGWEYMRCSKASIFWMTFFSPWSWMPMSSIGSSKGTPSGKRFWTSYNKAWKINSSAYKISKTNFFYVHDHEKSAYVILFLHWNWGHFPTVLHKPFLILHYDLLA